VPALKVLLGVGKQTMKIKAARTHPATMFFIMAATPRWLAHTTIARPRSTRARVLMGGPTAGPPAKRKGPDDAGAVVGDFWTVPSGSGRLRAR
jgi:hypothetical protein